MKKILSRPVTFLFLICCLFVFLGPVAFADEPKYGGTLRIGVRVPVFNRLDFRNLFTPAAIPAEGLIYDRLFTWGPEGFEKMIPALATGYETNDNKVWIIHLRKGVKFHNGREMTAEDIKTNFEWRITTPKGWKPVKARTLIKYLKAVEVVDRYTVKVILDKPFSSLLRVLAWAMRGIVPPEEAYKWGGKFTFQPVGTGPYKVVEVKPREKVVFEPNPNTPFP